MNNPIILLYSQNKVDIIDLNTIKTDIKEQILKFGINTYGDIHLVLDSNLVFPKYFIFTFNDSNWYFDEVFPQKNNDTIALIQHNDIIISSDNIIICVCEKAIFNNFINFNLKKHRKISIGYSNKCTFQLIGKKIIETFIEIQIDENNSYIISNILGNNIYINDEYKAHNGCALKEGDYLSFLGIKIIFKKNMLLVNRLNDALRISNINNLKTNEYKPFLEFKRVPRFKMDLPIIDIDIKAPPKKSDMDQNNNLISLMQSLMTSFMFALLYFSVYSNSKSNNTMTLVLMPLITAFTAIITYIFSQTSYKKKYRLETENRKITFLKYLNNIELEITLYQCDFRNTLNSIYPSSSQCFEYMNNIEQSMWGTLPVHDDFLNVRLGTGSNKFDINIKISNEEWINDDPLYSHITNIKETYQFINNVPIIISIRENFSIGFYGELKNIIANMISLVTNLAYNHSYTEVKFVFLFSEKHTKYWTWVKNLPHVWDERRTVRYVASNKKDATYILSDINSILNKRFENKKSFENKSTLLPHYILFISDFSLIEGNPISSFIELYKNPQLGFSCVFIEDSYNMLPANCTNVIKVTDTKCEISDIQNNSHKRIYTLDVNCDNLQELLKKALTFSRIMASIRLSEFKKTDTFPDKVSFFDIFMVDTPEDLDIETRWSKNFAYNGLNTPIGLKEGNKTVELNISENEHGPHGLIGGTTGSGKSELIQTLILSLAVNYSPKEITFLFVDFKGGATAKIFETIPHNAGILTNIDGDGEYHIIRALECLQKEIKERQSILQKPYEKIDLYQKAYYEGKVDKILPHLMIIVDEFAELKQEHPFFITHLISISRIGRSLGIHLLLATQKPAGVISAEMWSNSKYRICLKVQDAYDSRDIIKKTCAADIKVVGQAYLQVGNDEVFEFFQSAWSGAEYKYSAWEDDEIFEVLLNGKHKKINNTAVDISTKPTQLNAVIQYMENMSSDFISSKIWTKPLNNIYYLDDIIGFDGEWNWEKYSKIDKYLCPAVGYTDDIFSKKQEVFHINFKKGHLAIYGGLQKGKTTFITTIILSILRSHSPEDVNIYIIDYGSNFMDTYSGFPHVGDVILSDNTDKTLKFFKFINSELDKRKNIFSKKGCRSFEQYLVLNRNESENNNKIPAIIIFIDNLEKLKDAHNDVEDTLYKIINDSITYGVFFVISFGNKISFKLNNNLFATIAGIGLKDKDEYSNLFGRLAIGRPANLVGRGIIKTNEQPPLEFQVALPTKSEDEIIQNKMILKIIDKMAKSYNGTIAPKIPLLPVRIEYNTFIQNLKSSNCISEKTNDIIIPLGLSIETLEPIFVNLSKSTGFLISVKSIDLKITLILFVLKHLRKEYKKTSEICILESQNKDLMEFVEEMQIDTYITNNENDQLEGLLQEFVDKINSKQTPPAKNTILILHNFHSLLSKIDYVKQPKIFEMMSLIIRQGLKQNIYVVAFSSPNEGTLNETLKVLTENGNGIIHGGTPSEHKFDISLLNYQDRSCTLKENEIYLFTKSSATKTKLIDIDSL